MKLKLAMLLGLLLGLASSALAQQPFPNTYSATPTLTYDRIHGTIDPARGVTPGTVTVTVSFHGSTTGTVMNQSGVQHKPYPFVKVKNATQGFIGPGFLPNTDMNGWSHTFTFDLQNSGCDFQVLETGGCEIDNEPQIQCPIHGYFAIPWKKLQLEAAITVSVVERNTKGVNGQGVVFYDATSWCTPISNPPDFPGPDTVYEGSDPIDATGYIKTEDLCWRLIDWGSPGNGEPWSCFNVPRINYTPYIDMESDANFSPQLCTYADGGVYPDWP